KRFGPEAGPLKELTLENSKVMVVARVQNGRQSGCAGVPYLVAMKTDADPDDDLVRFDPHGLPAHHDCAVVDSIRQSRDDLHGSASKSSKVCPCTPPPSPPPAPHAPSIP